MLADAAPTESERMRILQEHREQIQLAELASVAAASRERLRDAIAEFYFGLFQDESIPQSVLTIYCRMAKDHGLDSLMAWLEIASTNLGSWARPTKVVKYVCGIRRRLEERGEL